MKRHMNYLVLLALLLEPKLWAVCATLIKGPIALDVLECNAVNPEQAFPLNLNKYSFISDLPPANRSQFLGTYRGLLIRGQVARSLAIRSGLSNEKGALSGEKILAFIDPQQMNCEAIQSKRLQATVDEICCEGGGEAPCLLGTGLKLIKPQIVAEPSSRGARRKPEVQAAYRDAAVAVARHDHKVAIAVLEKLRATQSLDLQGNYLLALSYREADRCPAALPLLELVYKKLEANSYWQDEEIYVRRGTLLMARCLALLTRPNEAAVILQAFLVEPARYKQEILESLSHPDFGGARTDKQFMKYREKAQHALSSN